MRIPLPNVSYNILFLCAKLARLVDTHLHHCLGIGRSILPCHLRAVDGSHHITIRSTVAIKIACPPCAAGSSYIVLIETGSDLHILKEMSVSCKHMAYVRRKHLGKLIGILNVVDSLH